MAQKKALVIGTTIRVLLDYNLDAVSADFMGVAYCLEARGYEVHLHVPPAYCLQCADFESATAKSIPLESKSSWKHKVQDVDFNDYDLLVLPNSVSMGYASHRRELDRTAYCIEQIASCTTPLLYIVADPRELFNIHLQELCKLIPDLKARSTIVHTISNGDAISFFYRLYGQGYFISHMPFAEYSSKVYADNSNAKAKLNATHDLLFAGFQFDPERESMLQQLKEHVNIAGIGPTEPLLESITNNKFVRGKAFEDAMAKATGQLVLLSPMHRALGTWRTVRFWQALSGNQHMLIPRSHDPDYQLLSCGNSELAKLVYYDDMSEIADKLRAFRQDDSYRLGLLQLQQDCLTNFTEAYC